ncbi:MAG: hypothetical protein GW873_10325 [Nitrospirae bacterium]|nr:hypothetical protein [Nitrospirota bacterium]
MVDFLQTPSLLSKGVYLQLVVEMKLLDDAIIRKDNLIFQLLFRQRMPFCLQSIY